MKVLLLLSFFINLYASEYEVKKNDTLSEIVLREMGTPIYGENGNLKRIQKLNPDITNPDLIFPLQILLLKEKLKKEIREAQLDPIPVEEKKNLYQRKHHFLFSFYSSYYSITGESKSSDDTAKAISTLYLGLGLEHKYDFSKSFNFVSSFYYESGKFEVQENVSILEETKNFYRVSFGLEYPFKKKNVFTPTLSYEKDYLLSSFDATTRKLSDVHYILLGLEYKREVYRRGSWASHALMAFESSISSQSDIDIDSSFNYNLGLETSYKSLLLSVIYKNRTLETAQVEQNTKNLRLGLNYIKDL